MYDPIGEDIRKTKAKCPKCKSVENIVIYEKCIHFQTWYQTNGLVNYNSGYMNPGDVVGTFGECNKCGYKWKFKCLQITDLFV